MLSLASSRLLKFDCWLPILQYFVFLCGPGAGAVQGPFKDGRCGSLHHGRPDRERTEEKGGKSFFGRQLSERTSVSSDTHSAKRERAQAEGARERRLSSSSPSGLKCRAALPVPCASAPGPKSISLTHPPSLFHAVPSGTASASALNDGLSLQVSPPLWSGRAHGPVRGCHPSRRRCEDGTVQVRFTWTWDFLLGISHPFHFIVSSRISFSALFLTLRRHRCRLLRQRLFYTSTTIPRMRRSQSPSVFYRRLRTSWYSAYFIGPYFCYCGLLNSAERIVQVRFLRRHTLKYQTVAHRVTHVSCRSWVAPSRPTSFAERHCELERWNTICVFLVDGKLNTSFK